MKSVQNMLHALRDEYVLFALYRWLAWGLALIEFLRPGRTAENGAQAIGMLALTAVLALLMTFFARPYVRLARRRPLVLGLDIVASVALIWLGNGTQLPLLPYALGALVLPALMLGWPGALVSGALFTLLDQLAFVAAQLVLTDSAAPELSISRAAAPLWFGLMVAGIDWLTDRAANERRTPGNLTGGLGAHEGPSRFMQRSPRQQTLVAPLLTQRAVMARADLPSISTPTPGSLTAVGTPDNDTQELRNLIFELTPGNDVVLSEALDRLAANFSRQSGVTTSLTLVGAVQPLTPAQVTILRRLAQEALLNIQLHSRAQSGQMILAFEANSISLTIQDDGVGLLDGTHERPGLHALRAMRYRLAELDGRLEVFEGEQYGVTVRGTLPLN